MDILRKIFSFRVCRFLLVGFFNSIFGFSVFSLIVFLGGETWLALLGGNVAGVFFNFFTIGGFVFLDLRFHRIPLFVLVYVGLFFTNLKSIEYIIVYTKFDRITAQALLTAPMAILSYFVMKEIVFRNRD